ncbi:MAG: class I SAM-dependent methyltransferase [Chloroflexi bacterium]|nr:MAG: class I SAM-dependent methyltransferase [Chloroflexota bacterium]
MSKSDIKSVEQGYEVTLLDLSQENLALAKAKAAEARVKLAGIVHGNALDLSQFSDKLFDVVLMFGPLYHLMESFGLNTLNLIGCEGVTSQVEGNVNQLEGADWELWVDFNYRMGQDPSLHGATEHLLYIGEKS